MSRRLYLVSLEQDGAMLAGSHFLAADAAEARAIGEARLTDLAGLPDFMVARLILKLEGGYSVRAVASSAKLSQALNA